MPRALVLTIVCGGLLGLSWPSERLTAARAALDSNPAVEAAPLAAEAGTPARARILKLLRSQHTALADRELVALARTIEEEAARHGFDPDLVMAVIEVESGGYHLAISPVGARGLMQLLPTTAEELAGKLDLEWRGPNSLFDPLTNVKLGTAYLRQLSDRYDSVPTALAAYNWGPGRIDRRLRRGASIPSRYVRRVMKAYDAKGRAGARRS